MVRIMIGAVALLSLVSAAHAKDVAAPDTDKVVQTRVVKYGDLNITGPAGLAEFKRRIAHAVAAVCTGGPEMSVSYWDQQRCRKESARRAEANVLAAIDRERLYAARKGSSIALAGH